MTSRARRSLARRFSRDELYVQRMDLHEAGRRGDVARVKKLCHWYDLDRRSGTSPQIPLIWSGIGRVKGDMGCRRFRGTRGVESQASRGSARKASRTQGAAGHLTLPPA